MKNCNFSETRKWNNNAYIHLQQTMHTQHAEKWSISLLFVSKITTQTTDRVPHPALSVLQQRQGVCFKDEVENWVHFFVLSTYAGRWICEKSLRNHGNLMEFYHVCTCVCLECCGCRKKRTQNFHHLLHSLKHFNAWEVTSVMRGWRIIDWFCGWYITCCVIEVDFISV